MLHLLLLYLLHLLLGRQCVVQLDMQHCRGMLRRGVRMAEHLRSIE